MRRAQTVLGFACGTARGCIPTPPAPQGPELLPVARLCPRARRGDGGITVGERRAQTVLGFACGTARGCIPTPPAPQGPELLPVARLCPRARRGDGGITVGEGRAQTVLGFAAELRAAAFPRRQLRKAQSSCPSRDCASGRAEAMGALLWARAVNRGCVWRSFLNRGTGL